MTTPTTDPIRDAFEAMTALLQMLIARKFSGLYTPAVRLGVEAAEEVNLTHWHPQEAFLALRDLVIRAAEEHARRTEPQDRTTLVDAALADELAEFERDARDAPDAWPNPLVRRLAAVLHERRPADATHPTLTEEQARAMARTDAAGKRLAELRAWAENVDNWDGYHATDVIDEILRRTATHRETPALPEPPTPYLEVHRREQESGRIPWICIHLHELNRTSRVLCVDADGVELDPALLGAIHTGIRGLVVDRTVLVPDSPLESSAWICPQCADGRITEPKPEHVCPRCHVPMARQDSSAPDAWEKFKAAQEATRRTLRDEMPEPEPTPDSVSPRGSSYDSAAFGGGNVPDSREEPGR